MAGQFAGALAVTGDSSVTDTVTSGPFLVAAGLSLAAGVVSLAAGVVSFASPCVLPLVPGNLSYLVGLVGTGEADGGRGSGKQTVVRARAVRATALFVLGFTVDSLAESLLVPVLVGNPDPLTRIGGVITVMVGLAMLGWIRPMQREVRIHTRPTGRVLGAPLLGVFFAMGWTACIGPALTGVNALAISIDWNGNACPRTTYV